MLVIGFAKEYFTLWDVIVEKNYTTIRGVSRLSSESYKYLYIKNLSKDKDLAVDKVVKEYGVNAEIDKDLRGKTRSYVDIKEYNIYNVSEFDRV